MDSLVESIANVSAGLTNVTAAKNNVEQSSEKSSIVRTDYQSRVLCLSMRLFQKHTERTKKQVTNKKTRISLCLSQSIIECSSVAFPWLLIGRNEDRCWTILTLHNTTIGCSRNIALQGRIRFLFVRSRRKKRKDYFEIIHDF